MLSCVVLSSKSVRQSTYNCPKPHLKSVLPSSSPTRFFASGSSADTTNRHFLPRYFTFKHVPGTIPKIRSHTRRKESIRLAGRKYVTMPSSTALSQAHMEASVASKRLLEVWKEWEKEEDPFAKRSWGKDLINLYAALSKQLSIVAKDEADFEHLATIQGHPVAQNCYRLGMVHAQRLEWEPAIESLQRCVDLDPGNYTHYMKFGEVLHAARMYGSAVQAYTAVLNTMSSEFKKVTEKPKEVPRPDSFEASIFKGLEFTPRVQYPFSKLAEVLYRRGHSHLLQNDWEMALADWKSVIGLEPNQRTAESWAYLAHLSRINGKWQQTVDLSTKALEYDSELLIALYERSMAHFVLKNEEKVKSDNRKYAILAHERMWGLSNHPIQPDWGSEMDSQHHQE